MAINWKEADIEAVVASVLRNLKKEPAAAATERSWNSKSYEGRDFIGVYDDMNDAIDAANAGYRAVRAMSLE